MIKYTNNTFYISTANTSYIFKNSPEGLLIHTYYGKRIAEENMDFYNLYISFDYTAAQSVGENITTMDALPQECPSRGRGDYRTPAVIIEAKDGRGVNEYRYVSHTITKGAPKLCGLPHLDANPDKAETLEIVLKDTITKATLHLFYTVFEEIDIIARHTVVENTSEETITVKNIASAALDFEESDFDMVSLYGRWANERTVERYPIKHGKSVISTTRGASSHELNPFAALAKKDATETNGDVYGVSLIYSGNFEISANVGQFSGTRFLAGINPESFSWELAVGESFVSPQAVLTYSSEGFGKMSRNFHKLCRTHLGACAKNVKHPIVYNLWEAFYFEVTEEKALKTFETVKDFGVDTLVLDDGWFGDRNGEETAMGDWFINKEKFPGGLDRLIALCKENNLNFGLWFEPEMIGPISELYKAHPDWCIHIPDVEPVQSRCQLILDFSRDEVVDAVYDTIATLLNKYEISYVKWDMNRNMTDFGSHTLPSHRQGEHAHRYILGVYKLMERFVNDFPHIFFEGSAGGGGRFDFGILYYMPQIWTSDNSDALGRLKIQHGTSFVYPPETMSSHVSVCPNHQTYRITPLKSRGDVAQLFSFGYELNPKLLTDEEISDLKAQIVKHRELETWLNESDFYRLIDPANGENCAWQMVSYDKKHSAVLYMTQLTKPKLIGRYLKLQGLDENKQYRVEPLGETVSGSTLMYAGIPINTQQDDFTTILFEIHSV